MLASVIWKQVYDIEREALLISELTIASYRVFVAILVDEEETVNEAKATWVFLWFAYGVATYYGRPSPRAEDYREAAKIIEKLTRQVDVKTLIV